jgi:hypothetical protein
LHSFDLIGIRIYDGFSSWSKSQTSFRSPQKLYGKLSVLAGDVANSVNFAPNKQQREVHAVLKERLANEKSRFGELIKTDLAAFNDFLKKKNISGIIFPKLE